MTSWIQSLLSAVGSLWEQLDGHHFLRDVRSFEPRAWLILVTIFLVVGAVNSFVGSTRVRMASARQRARRFDSAWERFDGE